MSPLLDIYQWHQLGTTKCCTTFLSSDKLTRAVVMQECSPALATLPIISSTPTQLSHLHPFITAGVLSGGGVQHNRYPAWL